MYSYSENFGELSSWIRKEVEFHRDIRNGNRGTDVKRVQEWLNLHGFGIAIDSAFGPVTAHAVKRFQDAADVDINVGSFFLVRRTPTDWMHTGVVINTHEVGFDTIEGNTNDDGHHEGYEVCSRSRGYANKDYVLVI